MAYAQAVAQTPMPAPALVRACPYGDVRLLRHASQPLMQWPPLQAAVPKKAHPRPRQVRVPRAFVAAAPSQAEWRRERQQPVINRAMSFEEPAHDFHSWNIHGKLPPKRRSCGTTCSTARWAGLASIGSTARWADSG